ncbi:hypothetical protein KKA93_01720 [Patescibacteria group bacterium]|nr:hypothetical protein [Patescibacteria group bacterium]MBU1663172.1 hypothetical protein [Patescibacteria group bacterium]MBU1934297.1 hypothetical protein [Patescibacteria group bacterium]MBU2008146.1 hypothetical protein [Patescibacteria group bacterium]MBU2233242.1 hypothetical protein [Patescibacteria group bacterium]
MLEEKNITSAKVMVKKIKAVKKRVKKSPIRLNDNLNIVSAVPEAGFKLKEEPLASKSGEPKSIYRKIAFSFIVLTLILAATVLYFGFSKLTITIIPAQEKIVYNSTVEVISQTSSSTLSSEQIYGMVKQAPVEQFKEFSVSGKEVLGEEITGKVTIINNYIKNQPLVATTRLLSSDNKLFRLKDTVNVPAGGQVEAEIYADVVKPEMAVGLSKFTLPGLWAGIQDKIYAKSKEPMKYNRKIKYTIGQSDIDNAVSQLKNDVLANVKNQVGQTYKDYAKVLFMVDNNSVTQDVNGKVGEEKEKFSIKMKTIVTVVAFNDDEVYNQIKAKLMAMIADDKEISEFNKQNMSYALESFDITQATARVNVDSMTKAILKDGAKAIKKNNLAGLNYEQLKVYLNGLPEVAGYQIKFFPSFIKKAPNLVDRIKIEIKR